MRRKLEQQLIKDLPEYNKLIKELKKDDRGEGEFSDFKLDRQECEKCQAVWINGQHVWRGTGNTSDSQWSLTLLVLFATN